MTEDIASLVKCRGRKWFVLGGDEDADSRIATVLENGEVFMFYFDKGDRDTGWALSSISDPKDAKRQLKDIFWDDSGTDDMNHAFERFETWLATDGQQFGYDIEEDEDYGFPGMEEE